MKLYFWDNPYDVPWGQSAVFAVAESLEEAKSLANSKQAKAWAYFNIPQSEPPHVELGEPTRVVDLPCAEWHYWSE